MGFFSRLFGKKSYEEELKENCAEIIEKAEMENRIINYQNGVDAEFQFRIDDVFSITGRGTVVTGRVICGSIQYGDSVMINGIETVVLGIESFRKTINVAKAGDSVGIFLKGVTKNQVQRGDLLYK